MLPVNVIVGEGLSWQTDVVPLITAVGNGLTVIVAEPVISDGRALHVFALRETKVYVVVEEGLTLTDITLKLLLKVVPSDRVPLHGPIPVTEILSIAD